MKTKEYVGSPGVYEIHCPGCNTSHSIWTERFQKEGPKWGFNNDLEKPTFTPSVRISWPYTGEDGVKKENCCHFHITDGKIAFCGDCTHELSGQTFDLQDLN